MNVSGKSIAWAVAALLLLLSIAVPGINIVTVFLLMVPYVVLYTTLSKAGYALHIAAVIGISFVLIGPIALFIGLFFLVPSIVMGHLYRKQTPAKTVMTAVGLTLLAQFLLELVIFTLILGVSPIAELGEMVRSSTTQLVEQGMLQDVWTEDMTAQLVSSMKQSIPLALISVCFMYVVITQWVARAALKRQNVEVPGFKPAREWMLPRIMVFYYLIIIILELVVDQESQSFMNVVLLNLMPLLRLAFQIQAVGLFFYIAYKKRWNRAVPILLAIPVFLFPPLSLIGVLDVAFPIRKSFEKP